MKTIMLGVGEYGVSKTEGEVVKTMALGSCVGLIFLHPPTKTVGVVHIALPESKSNPERAKERPGYFTDTGIPAIIKLMESVSGAINTRAYKVKMAGGLKLWTPTIFSISGKEIFWQ